MHYTTYWSILDTPAKSITSAAIFLCIAIVAIIGFLLVKKFKKDSGEGDKKLTLWVTGAFAVLGFVGYGLLIFYPDKTQQKAREMLNASTTPRIEGVISNFERTFRRTSKSDETIETFTVDTIHFRYSDNFISSFQAFTKTYNDVIFDGQKVRITYSMASSPVGKYASILKLEIADSDEVSPSDTSSNTRW